jgi:hypothetical protein
LKTELQILRKKEEEKEEKERNSGERFKVIWEI